jgi:hypothetical protein
VTPDNVLHLYCPAGFSYVSRNEVYAYLNGGHVSLSIAVLVRAFTGAREYACPGPHNGIDVTYGESFTLDDFAETCRDLFQIEVRCHDGEGLPNGG